MIVSLKPDPEQKTLSPVAKMILEIGPLVIFFIANNRYDIFVATAVFMVAMAISLAVHYTLVRHLPVMPLVTGVVVLVFGGLTLYLEDEMFIKLKPTIVNVLFGGTLLIGYYFKKYFLEYVFSAAFNLDREGWRILTLRWSIFFLFLAVLNEVVWRNFSTDFWVGFKIWGVMPITIVFTMFQLAVVQKHTIEDENAPQ